MFVGFVCLFVFCFSLFQISKCPNYPVRQRKSTKFSSSSFCSEVEYARRLLSRFLLQTQITKVVYPDTEGLAKRFLNCSPMSFADALTNRKIVEIKRHGKYLWFEMADEKALTPIFHFGMSGGFRIKSAPDVTYLKELERVKNKAKNEIEGQCESFVYGETI